MNYKAAGAALAALLMMATAANATINWNDDYVGFVRWGTPTNGSREYQGMAKVEASAINYFDTASEYATVSFNIYRCDGNITEWNEFSLHPWGGISGDVNMTQAPQLNLNINKSIGVGSQFVVFKPFDSSFVLGAVNPGNYIASVDDNLITASYSLNLSRRFATEGGHRQSIIYANGSSFTPGANFVLNSSCLNMLGATVACDRNAYPGTGNTNTYYIPSISAGRGSSYPGTDCNSNPYLNPFITTTTTTTTTTIVTTTTTTTTTLPNTNTYCFNPVWTNATDGSSTPVTANMTISYADGSGPAMTCPQDVQSCCVAAPANISRDYNLNIKSAGYMEYIQTGFFGGLYVFNLDLTKTSSSGINGTGGWIRVNLTYSDDASPVSGQVRIWSSSTSFAVNLLPGISAWKNVALGTWNAQPLANTNSFAGCSLNTLSQYTKELNTASPNATINMQCGKPVRGSIGNYVTSRFIITNSRDGSGLKGVAISLKGQKSGAIIPGTTDFVGEKYFTALSSGETYNYALAKGGYVCGSGSFAAGEDVMDTCEPTNPGDMKVIGHVKIRNSSGTFDYAGTCDITAQDSGGASIGSTTAIDGSYELPADEPDTYYMVADCDCNGTWTKPNVKVTVSETKKSFTSQDLICQIAGTGGSGGGGGTGGGATTPEAEDLSVFLKSLVNIFKMIILLFVLVVIFELLKRLGF